MRWDWGYALVALAFIVALLADGIWSERAGWGSIVILGATAIVVVAYTAQTRRLAEETQRLAKETRSLATSTEQLAGEAPLRHALWSKRLDCYSRIAGILPMYLRDLVGADDATRLRIRCDLGRAWGQAMILFPCTEDPPGGAFLVDIMKFLEKKSPTQDDVAELLADWQLAVRKSLGLPDIEQGISDFLREVEP